MRLPDPPILVITDRKQVGGSLAQLVASVIDGGCRWASLREKDLSTEERRALLDQLYPAAKAKGARLMVHDDLPAAAAVDGIHLPSGGDVAQARARLGRRLVGRSAHDLAEAQAAAAAGADYITLSPIFESQSKPGYGPALGLERLAAIAGQVEIPVLALGGVTEATAASCLTAGATGFAVMGEIMRADDPGLKFSEFAKFLR